MSRSSRAIIALVVILALCVSVGALAAKMHQSAQPAKMGAGGGGSATASSTANEAWIYTGDFHNTTPMSASGTIRLTASTGATISQHRSSVTAQFTWEGATYKITVTSPYPMSGEAFPGHGPVQFMRPVFGSSDLGTLDLPETHAHVAVYGRAMVTKNGKAIAENQPAIVLVNQAIHGSDQAFMSSPDTSRNEMSLIIPGPLDGQKFVKGFPNGYFYIYWPNTTMKLSGNTSPKPMPQTIPSRSGRGPAAPMLGTETPRGTINLSLTNSGIRKSMGEATTGLYNLKITNNSSRTRGLVILGLDLCCTNYVRYSKLLKPGQSQMFRWYFAPGKVQLKDFTGGVRTSTSWTKVRFGGHSNSVIFDAM